MTRIPTDFHAFLKPLCSSRSTFRVRVLRGELRNTLSGEFPVRAERDTFGTDVKGMFIDSPEAHVTRGSLFIERSEEHET